MSTHLCGSLPTHLSDRAVWYVFQFIVSSDARCSCDDIEFEDEIILGTIPLAPAPPPDPLDLPMTPTRRVPAGRRRKKGSRQEEVGDVGDVVANRKTAEDQPVTGECGTVLSH